MYKLLLCLYSILFFIVIVRSGQHSIYTLIYTSTSLRLEGSTQIYGSVYGNKNLTVTTGSKIYDALIDGNVIVDLGSTAHDITASGSVTINTGGTAHSVANSSVTPAILFNVSTLQTGAATASSGTINPGCYNSLSVSAGGTITLTAGTYSFNSVNIADGAVVTFENSGTGVVVTVSGNFNGGHGIRLNGNATHNVLLVKGNLTVGNGNVLNANFFVPTGSVYFGYGTVVKGAIYSKQIILTPGDSVTAQSYFGYSSPGPVYSTASVSRNASHLNTTFPVTYYYPTNATSGQTFPLFVFLQGFNCPRSIYSIYASLVASYGYVVAVPDYYRTISGFPGSYYFSSSLLINSIEDDVRNNGGVPANPDIVIAGGHSQGSVNALIALGPTCTNFLLCEDFVRRSTLKGAVVFGANNRNQSNTAFDSFVDTPADGRFVTFLTGAIDSRALPSRSQGTFEAVSNTNKKSIIYYNGMNHFGITDTATPVGPVLDPVVETGDHTEGLNLLARDTHLSIQGYLNSNVGAIQFFLVGYRDNARYSREIQILHPCS